MVKKRWLWLPPFMLIFAVANLVRGVLFFVYRPTLADWELSIPSGVLGAIYIVLGCGLAGAAVAYRVRRDLRVALGAGIAYQIAVWALALAGYRSTYAQELWVRDLLLSVLFLATLAWLGWKAPARRADPPQV